MKRNTAAEFYVTEEAALDEAASVELTALSIGEIRRLIAAGLILLNGRRASPSAKVMPGDVITLEDGAEKTVEIMPLPPEFSVLFEDAQAIAVDKPAGIAVVPERGSSEWPFMGMLLHHARGCPTCKGVRFRIVHRIDRDTTGVVIVAKTLDAGRRLAEQFAAGTVRKRYQAIVQGEPSQDSGVVDVPIAASKRGKALMTVAASGKPSVTQWRVAERFRGYALLDVFPRTGRTHQIRLHLAHVGMPLAVDAMYGGASELLLSGIKRGYKRRGPETPLMDRLTLHCAEVEVAHPATGQAMKVSAPLPEDFERTLKALRKWAPPNSSAP